MPYPAVADALTEMFWDVEAERGWLCIMLPSMAFYAVPLVPPGRPNR
jgi:hypothetical protein